MQASAGIKTKFAMMIHNEDGKHNNVEQHQAAASSASRTKLLPPFSRTLRASATSL
jgi:hypothetical protein